MPIAIRKLFGLTLFVQILCLDSAPWARAEEIRVLYYPPWNISKLPLYLARDTGIFERSGLPLSWADPAGALISGQISGSLVTAEAMYDLEKTGRFKDLRVLTDHKQLKIYAGGGADYAMSSAFLRNHRLEAKSFMSGICQGIALARQDKPKALEFVAKTVRKGDAAMIEYLYRLYTTEVIPARPYPKAEGVELGIQMVASLVPAGRTTKASELVDTSLMQEVEKEGRCNF